MEDLPEKPLLIKKQSSNLRCHFPQHNSNLEFICLDPKCVTKRLICSECHKTSHDEHQVMHYNVFLQLCQEKTVQLKNLQAVTEEQLKKAEISHIENLNQIKENFCNFVDQIIEKQTSPFFDDLKVTTNTFINPDIINTAIGTLGSTMENTFDITEINNQLEIITQNLTYSDEQLGLKLQFGPGIFTSKILNEVNSMTETITAFHTKTKADLQEKITQIYTVASRNIQEHTKKVDEIPEKTDFLNLKIAGEFKYPIEQEEIKTIEIIQSSDKINESVFAAVGLKSGFIKIFDLLTNTPIKKFFAHENECIRLMFIEATMNLFSSGLDKKLAVWKVSDNFSFQTSIQNNSGPFVDFCWVFDENLLGIIGGKTLSLTQMNLIPLKTLDFDDNITKVAYISSVTTVSRLICGTFKGSIIYVDIISHGENMKIASVNCNIHEGYIENIHVVAKKDLIITSGYGDKKLVLHETCNFQKIKEINFDFLIFHTFHDNLDEIILLESGLKEVAVLNLQNDKIEHRFKSVNMGSFVWINSRKTLICGYKCEENNKNFIFLRCFE